MESLKTLTTTGRGRGVRGRWRNYRNNTTIRGEIWRLLRYKCWLAGIRFYTARPRDTSHTCPHCGAPAQTYRSPRARQRGEAAVEWGRWLWCAACHYNVDRDYCASLNVARLGIAALVHRQQTGAGRAFAVRDPQVKPVSYTATGSVLLLPPIGRVPARLAPPRGAVGKRSAIFLAGMAPHSCNRRCPRQCSSACAASIILLRIVPDQSNGTAQIQMAAAKARLPPITKRWKTSWKPKIRGNGLGHFSA